MTEINYSDVSTFFSSPRKMKQFIKHCDLSVLIELRDKLDSSINAREYELEKEREAEKQRTEKRTELMALINSEGFTLDELISSEPKKNKGHRKMKYRYTENGKVKLWAGVGRTPRAIQDALNSGECLDSFLINEQTINEKG